MEQVVCPNCETQNTADSRFCKSCATPLPDAGEISFTKTLVASKDELPRGSTFANRYEIIEELGIGGMGRVYRAFDKQLEEEVALKFLKSEIAAEKKTVERFRNEIRFARKITHPNVCRMHDLGEEDQTFFITMEYVRGEDLKSVIHRMGTLTVGKAVSITRQVAEGLTQAHKIGVVHRDLKPSNIMVDKDGNAKIMDFGIARSVAGGVGTAEGALIGTPEYMSPEQVEGKAADMRADIYALGIILYEMATGRRPFEGDTSLAIAHKQKYEAPPDPRTLNPQIRPNLNKVILRCLEKEKEARYQTTSELLADLAAVEEALPTSERVSAGLPSTARKPVTEKTLTVKITPKRLIIPGVVVTAVVAGILLVLPILTTDSFIPPPMIENSIAVISFENQTGDKTYDIHGQQMIPELLRTSLEDSGLFALVPTGQQLVDHLKKMGKKDTELIDLDQGYELCRRMGCKALVSGGLYKTGESFNILLRIYDAESRESIDSIGSEPGSVENIHVQINDLSREICESLGKSLENIGPDKFNIADVTTSSLEAYEVYLKGQEQFWKWRHTEARDAFEEAVRIDPSFASAWRWLARTYAAGTKERRELLAKAFELSSQATEKEKMYIRAQYVPYREGSGAGIPVWEELIRKFPWEKEAHFMLGHILLRFAPREMLDWNRGMKELETAVDIDPNFSEAYNYLGIGYWKKGNYEKAHENLKKYISTSPGNANTYDTMGELYFKWGKLDKSVAYRKKAVKINPDLINHQIYWALAYTEALRENYRKSFEWLDRQLERDLSQNSLGWNYHWRSFINSWIGRFDQALLDINKTEEITGYNYNFIRAMIYFLKGDYDISWEYLAKSHYANPSTIESLFYFGLTELKQGNLESARTRLMDMNSLFHTEKVKASWINDPWQEDFDRYIFVILESEIALHEENAEIDRILETFGEDRLFLAQENYTLWASNFILRYLHFLPYMMDFIPRAYLQNGELDKAIEAYERLVTFNPESEDRRLIHPRNYYNLGKQYEEKGLKRKAKANYRKFLKLWKDADPDIPELIEAKKRLAELKGN